MLPAVTYRQNEVIQLRSILEKWNESDTSTYIAFTYEGREHQDVIEAVIAKLKPKYDQLRQQYVLPHEPTVT